MVTTSSAYTELAGRVREIKTAHGPFAPITILVPTTAGCLDVTRSLASQLTEFDGLVNVRAETLSTLAEALFQNSPRAGARVPASNLVREAAVRASLSVSPGSFGTLATRQATVQAVARTSTLMDLIPLDDLDTIDATSLTAEIITHHRHVRAALAATVYFADEVLAVAGEALMLPAVRARLGHVISFQLAEPEIALERTFFEVLHDHVVDFVITAPRSRDNPMESAKQLVEAATLINATDADEEARAITRVVVEELNNGRPGHRIGIFMASEMPYRALLDRQLTAAGVTWSGSATHQLIDTSVARNLLRFLRAPRDEFDFRLVLDAMAERALVNSDPKFPTPAQAERDYRHLVRDDDDGPEDILEARQARERRALFRAYVDALRDEIFAALHSVTWLEAANSLQGLVNTHFTPSRLRKLSFGNDDFDTPAVWRQELDLAVTALGNLDGIAPAPTPAAIVEQLEASINERYLRHGKQGVGVALSTLKSGIARDFDVVIVCGLVEGMAPPRSFENPLFPDEAIQLVGNPIPTSRQQSRALQAQFTATLASASVRTILTYPRGNLRGGEPRVLSRWITSHFDEERLIPRVEVGSFLEGILTGAPATVPVAVTRQARDLAIYRNDPGILQTLPLTDELGNAVAMRRDRARGNFTAFNGNLSASKELITVMDRSISPTALEKYRRTPLSFFLSNVLRVVPLNDLIDSPTLDPLTRGTLVHEILEEWVLSAIAEPRSATLDTLLAFCDRLCDRYRAEVGVKWIEQYWQIDKFQITEDLRAWYRHHTAFLAQGWTPSAAEAAFGNPHAETKLPDVTIPLNDNSGTLTFVGQIDRIDKRPNGIHVIDYKGGSAKRYGKLSSSNITADGTLYQLAIYSKLAQQMLADDSEEATIQASYWFVRAEKETRPLTTIEMSARAAADLVDKLTTLTADVRAGAFPPIPDDGNYETYTNLLGTERMEKLWSKIRESEELLSLTDFWVEREEEEAFND
jgi:ATP-dependent helicase/nuclease subunit B